MTVSGLYAIEDGWIETYTGVEFHFLNPTKDMINIVDIAHALALQCRYNGHCKAFYSVAEHCVLMSDWFQDNGADALTCFTALMHDAAEAYIGDLPRPVKQKVPEFKMIEAKIDQMVAETFGTIYPFPKAVKDADSRILKDERFAVMRESKNVWGTDELESMGIVPKMWDPQTAEEMFIDRYFKYMDALTVV